MRAISVPNGVRVVFSRRTDGALAPVCLACLVLLLGAGGAAAQTDTDTSEADQARLQRKKALENWQRGLETGSPPQEAETKYLMVYSKLPEAELKPIAEQLHTQMSLAVKALGLERKDLWKGKLAVYLLTDRRDFSDFVRRVERRRVFAERGSVFLDKDYPHVVAGPRDEGVLPTPADFNVTEQAGAELAVALLRQKFPKDIPGWVEQGFGRATVLQSSPKAKQLTERRNAVFLITTQKRKAQDAWAGGVDPAEAAVLRGTLVQFLAYSGLTQKFVPFLQGFRPPQNDQEPDTMAALEAVGVNPDRLTTAWQYWLNSGR